MKKEEIKDGIFPIISSIACSSAFDLETSLESLYFDCLDMVECEMCIEDAFNISIPDDKWEQVKTVNDVINLVSEILEQQTTNN